jgi:hypothetical protein
MSFTPGASGAAPLRWFNPREMDDATIRLLSVGRDELLADLLRDIQKRLQTPSAGLHWLVTGNFGAGKSYFLRLLQAHAREHWPSSANAAPAVRVVLLPEELNNVGAPHDLLHEVRRMRRGDGSPSRGASWRTEHPQAEWQAELAALLGEMDEALLVVGVENLHVLMKETFNDDISASLFRQVLLHEPRIMWVATALNGSLDENYEQRLFRQFQHHSLPLWGPQAHRDYLALRGKQLQRPPNARQLVHIDAFSRFTGGNPRVAALLADAVLGQQDMLNASDDLNTALDLLSKYYTEQLGSMATNSRRCFDALLRGGEPASQVEVAKRMPNARQSDIARPFGWLVDTGHVHAEKVTGDKETHYRVSDRLFAQWYRMRNIEPGQRAALAVMADLIADTLSYGDKWGLAARMAHAGREDDAHLVASLAMRHLGGDIGKLLGPGQSTVPTNLVKEAGRLYSLEDPDGDFPQPLRFSLMLLDAYPTERAFLGALKAARQVALALPTSHRQGSAPAELVEGIWNSLSLDAAEKLRCLRLAGNGELSAFQWSELVNRFRDEMVRFNELRGTVDKAIRALELQRSLMQTVWPRALSWLSFAASVGESDTSYHPGSATAARGLQLAATANALLALRQSDLVFDPLTGRFSGELRFLGLLPPTVDEQLLRALQQGQSSIAVQVLERLISRWPKTTRKSDKALLGRCHYWLGEAALCEARFDDTRRENEKAFQLLVASNDLSFQCRALGNLAVAEAKAGNIDAALVSAQQSVEVSRTASSPLLPWLLGQLTRHTAVAQGAATALQQLSSSLPQLEISNSSQDWLWQQMADAVVDVHRLQGRAPAFDFACKLFSAGVSDFGRQPAKLLRSWVIDGVDMSMDPALMRDIIDQVPLLLPKDQEAPDLPATQQLLHQWLNELAEPVAERVNRRARMDPDLAITWQALEKELPFATRLRLGLAEKPVLEPEAQALLDKMLAMMG